MRIDALTLEGFRNYDRQVLTFHDSCNVIYGENAQGKTNLLEAMVYLSCGKSPRARAERELIGFDRDKARILGQMFTRDREFRTEVELFPPKQGIDFLLLTLPLRGQSKKSSVLPWETDRPSGKRNISSTRVGADLLLSQFPLQAHIEHGS